MSLLKPITTMRAGNIYNNKTAAFKYCTQDYLRQNIQHTRYIGTELGYAYYLHKKIFKWSICMGSNIQILCYKHLYRSYTR